jgi:DNA repair exonuclease SbcCD nuclease subunit
LAGDLFDGAYNRDTFRKVYDALEDVKIPVFITPGNHDFCQPSSPYLTETWPENVHIFKYPEMEAVELPALNCTVYGAGYQAMDCPALLENFRAEGKGKWQIGVLHADATNASSAYCPVTPQQVRHSGLHYLALGHIHKADSFRSGDAFCAWPGCPMGHGYDETGEKGVFLVDLGEETKMEFVPLNAPKFFDEELTVREDARQALSELLPGVATEDFYRVTLVGYSDELDMEALLAQFAYVKNLELRDKTIPERDLWSAVGEDSLEGMYFTILHNGLDTDSESLKQRIKLAAQISRQILDGQEVVLP